MHEILKSSQKHKLSDDVANDSKYDSTNVSNTVPLNLQNSEYISTRDKGFTNVRHLQESCNMSSIGRGRKSNILTYPSSITTRRLSWKPPSGNERKLRRSVKKYTFEIDDENNKKDKSEPITNRNYINSVSVNNNKDSASYTNIALATSGISSTAFHGYPENILTSSKRSQSLNLPVSLLQKDDLSLYDQANKVSTACQIIRENSEKTFENFLQKIKCFKSRSLLEESQYGNTNDNIHIQYFSQIKGYT